MEGQQDPDQDSVASFHSAHGEREFFGNCFGSNLVWLTFCSAILLVFILVTYVAQVGLANRNFPYIYLMILMCISMVGQGNFLWNRKNEDFVRFRGPMHSKATDFYIMAGLYLFGAGTVMSVLLNISLYIHSSFLLYNCFSHDNHTTKVDGHIYFQAMHNTSGIPFGNIYIYGGYCETLVAYEIFRLLFVLFQVGFIHSFRHACILKSSKVRFILSETLLTNLCIWFKYVSDETGLFGEKEPVIPGADTFTTSVGDFKDRLNPFILEFSLIAAGIFTNIASKMQDPLNFAFFNQVPLIGNNDNAAQLRRIRHPGTQPGLLIGIACGLLLVALGLLFDNSNNKLSEKSKAVFLVYESMITVTQAIFLIVLICIVVKHNEEEDNNENIWDYYLLSAAYFGTLVFDFVALYGISKSIYHKSDLPFEGSTTKNPDQLRDDILALVDIVFLSIFHPLQLLAITAYFRRFGPRQEMRSAAWIRQLTLFLITSNIGSWAVDSFIEIRNHVEIPYYSASYYFKGWDTIQALCFPFCVFYRFHSAMLLFEFWQRFKFG